MRRFAPAVAVFLVVLTPSAAARTPDCRTGGKTVVANSKVRVYRVSTDEGSDYFACTFGMRGRRFLGPQQTRQLISEWVEGVQLRGRFLVYARVTCTHVCEWRAFAVDMRTRRAVRKAKGGGSLKSVLMTPARSLAVLVNVGTPYNGAPAYWIWKVERSGRTLLDKGDDIDPQSLAVSRHRVYWMRGTEARSAPIE